MTKATICIAAAFSAVFAAGCSSSSSNNDGGTKEAGGVVLANDGSPLASPLGGACPGLPCTMPQTCCFNPLSGTGSCQDPGTMCNGIMSGCSGPSDCMDPMVCCGKAGGGGGRGGFNISCVAQGSCVSMSGGFAFQLCDSTHPCPTGDNCMPAPMGMGMFCLNPDAGLGFVRPMQDAGASADTGAREAGATPDTGAAADTGTAADTGATDTGSPDTGSPTDGGAG